MQNEKSIFWNSLYEFGSQGWDVGYAAPAVCAYFDQISDKSARILIPGAGNAYEAEYLHKQGFKNVFMLDFAEKPLQNFAARVPDFPQNHSLYEDFFEHAAQYDFIVEQTFFSSVEEEFREAFAKKMSELLVEGGKYLGIFFNHEFEGSAPPFGANAAVYERIFSPYFEFKTFEICKNSIKPRAGRELFFIFVNKML